MKKPIIFSVVNAKHKQFASLTEYLLENSETEHKEIERAVEFLNRKICELYKIRHV